MTNTPKVLRCAGKYLTGKRQTSVGFEHTHRLQGPVQ